MILPTLVGRLTSHGVVRVQQTQLQNETPAGIRPDKVGECHNHCQRWMTEESGATMTDTAITEARGVFLPLKWGDTTVTTNMRLPVSLDMMTTATKEGTMGDELEDPFHKDEIGESKMIITVTGGITAAANEADRCRRDREMTKSTIAGDDDREDTPRGLRAVKAAGVDIVVEDADPDREAILVEDVVVVAMMKSAATAPRDRDRVQQIMRSFDVAAVIITTIIHATRRRWRKSMEISHQSTKERPTKDPWTMK